MEDDILELNGSLSLSCLRLLVPPIRLVSAAIWQTVKQKTVLDYGMLEEFVYMVTDIVPELLKARQRAELVFGLRARLILELCRSEATADFEIIQPHLERMQVLLSLWDIEIHNADMEISDTHFLGLVHNLLRDPGERERFFQDVFPEEFGPVYDKAIQTLTWQFLSRLEELLPVPTVQQVASLLGDPSLVLQESMETVFHLQELKTLQVYQKDLNLFEDNDSPPDTCILSALFLPPVERVVIVSEQTGAIAEGDLVYTVHTDLEMEVATEESEVYIGTSEITEESADDQLWLGLGDGPATLDTVIVDTPGIGAVKMEDGSGELEAGNQQDSVQAGSDIQIVGRHQQKQVECIVVLERLDAPGPSRSRPVRRNRGLKMKTYLAQRRRAAQGQGSGGAGNTAKELLRHSLHAKSSTYACPACKRQYKTSRFLHKHKCPNQSPLIKVESTEAAEVRACSVAKEPATEGEKSGQASQVLADACYSSNKDPPSKELAPVSPECNRDTAAGHFSCPHCSVEFKCKQTFRFHLRNICYSEQQVDPEGPADTKRCFRCDECSKAFRYKSTLDSHKHTHNPLYCDVCMKLVRDAEALAMHKVSHTPFQCNLCDENFRVFKALHKHYVDAHSPSSPFDCGHCGAHCVSLKRLIRHEWKHTGHQPFQCPHCPKRFRSYSDLQEHQKKHTKAYPFLCWECGKKFRHNITLTRHVQREHKPGEAPPEKLPMTSLSCTQCSKNFTARRCLLRHIDFFHKGVSHPCPSCGKGFSGKDALVRHMLIHTGERPFKCDNCAKCFRSASELRVHSRYHTGERPFTCKVCNKGFVQSCFLTLHMRTHTGERPYTCAVCTKGFSSLHGLKRHKRLVHA